MMGGSITVGSKEGEGSVFTIFFNNIPVTEQEEIPSLLVENSSIIFDTADVLVVDDIPDNIILVKDNFKNTDLVFHEAANGQKAIDILLNRKIDMVFLDLRMPVMNGYETIDYIKKDDNLKDIPIVAMTASIMGKDMEKVSQYGFDGYLRKPVNHKELVKIAAQFLPYTEQKKIEDDAVIDFTEIPPENIERFMILVESRFKPEWEDIKDKGDFSLIGAFAASLKEEAQKSGIKPVEDYAVMLIDYTDSFDIITVDKLMNQFPDITSKLYRKRGEKDNDKNIQVGINFLKKNKDYHLLFATSGQQALERVKETKFDLILLDIIMPVMDGYEVCRKLKEDELTKNIPVLFLTAKHETEDIIKGFEAGGADYITKPFNSHELNARVKTHIELHYHYKKEIERLQDILFHSQRAETVSFLANGIAHDCNNFMCSISPNLYLINSKIKKHVLDQDEYTEYFQGINSAVAKISELLTQLSNYAIKRESESEIVDMNKVAADITKILTGSLKDTIELEIFFLDNPALAFANKIHIEQVLLNVIINAECAIRSQIKKDGHKGLTKMTISKVPGTEDPELNGGIHYLRIDIEDNGTGMSAETMKNIFTPYFTTRENKGGTGLGLAVSHSIVKSYKGIIKVRSEIGKGSCFSIYFPFYESE